MGKIITEPSIKLDNIEIEVDKNKTDVANSIMRKYGREIPVIKVGNHVVNPIDIVNFELDVTINDLPRFKISINDSDYVIREILKNDVDKCLIFIGWSTWYIKFEGLITEITNSYDDNDVYIVGLMYNEKLFTKFIEAFNEKTLSDILKEYTERTGMGLYLFDNNYLSTVHDVIINSNMNFIEFLKFILTNYTDNLFSIDPHYYIHIGNMSTIKKEPIEKYKLNENTGEAVEEKDIYFLTINNDIKTDIEFSDYIKNEQLPNYIIIKQHTVNTNYSFVNYNSANKYFLNTEEDSEIELKSNNECGFSDIKTNTFSGFIKHKNPFYNNKINKETNGILITILVENIIFELLPFSVVGLKYYNQKHLSNGDISKDIDDFQENEILSGNKICVGYKIIYNKGKKIHQLIELI